MDIERILKNVTIDSSGCWIWKKSTNSAGYGQLTVNKKYWLAHRYALSCKQRVLDTDVVRHSCHNPRCCNPDHLSVGTHADNYQDSVVVHKKADASRRKSWIIDGISYNTVREATKQTGISTHSIIKFTVNSVFDIEAYRTACKKAGWVPKI